MSTQHVYERRYSKPARPVPKHDLIFALFTYAAVVTALLLSK